MTSYSVRKRINAEPQVIWDLITDASSYPTWNPAVLGIDGTIAEGQKIKLTSIVNPDRQFKLNVAGVEAPRRMIWWDGMPLGLFKGVRTFTIEPNGDGSSDFHMEEVYSGLMAPLITKSIPDMTDSFEQFGNGVKDESERRAG